MWGGSFAAEKGGGRVRTGRRGGGGGRVEEEGWGRLGRRGGGVGVGKGVEKCSVEEEQEEGVGEEG